MQKRNDSIYLYKDVYMNVQTIYYNSKNYRQPKSPSTGHFLIDIFLPQ